MKHHEALRLFRYYMEGGREGGGEGNRLKQENELFEVLTCPSLPPSLPPSPSRSGLQHRHVPPP